MLPLKHQKSGKLKLMFLTLICIMVLLFYSSCSEQTIKIEETNNVTSINELQIDTESKRIWPNIPDEDWEGRNFHVLGRTSDRPQFVSFEIYSDGETGEVVNDAVYSRNRSIEEKYSVEITQNLVTDPAGELNKTISAGDDVYDLALLVQNTITPIAQTGGLYDLYSLPYIDFDKPWWNAELNSRISIGGKLFFTTSDFMLVDKQRTFILFMNRDMIRNYSLDNVYDLTREGLWTIDKMHTMCKTVSSDLDGDGVYTDLDQYGAGFEKYTFYVLTVASGNFIAGKDKEDVPTISINTPRTISTIDKILSITSDKTIMYFVEDYDGKVSYDFWGMSEMMFYDGRILFISDFPQTLKLMSANATIDYGIVPYPKYDEIQPKYYTCTAQASLITIPITAGAPEFTAFMLEALSAYSRYTSLPAYYEVSCKNKYTYDTDSAEMLDYIFDGIVYDLGALYNWGGLLDILSSTIPSSGTNSFSSLYASVESSAIAALEKTISEYRLIS
jgi:hypothetical protein